MSPPPKSYTSRKAVLQKSSTCLAFVLTKFGNGSCSLLNSTIRSSMLSSGPVTNLQFA